MSYPTFYISLHTYEFLLHISTYRLKKFPFKSYVIEYTESIRKRPLQRHWQEEEWQIILQKEYYKNLTQNIEEKYRMLFNRDMYRLGQEIASVLQAHISQNTVMPAEALHDIMILHYLAK